MTNLGFWQLRRLDERQASNADLEAVMAQPPVDIASYSTSTPTGASGSSGISDEVGAAAEGDNRSDGTGQDGTGQDGTGQDGTGQGGAGQGGTGRDGVGRDGAGQGGAGRDGDSHQSLADYSAVSATGVYRADVEFLIGHRSYQSQSGYWLATPMRLSDGRNVVVVRGWVPRRNVAGIDTRPTDPPPGVVTVTGLAFASVNGGRVAVTDADQIPELSRVDLDLFEQVSGLEVLDRWIRLTAQTPPQAELPVPVPLPELSNGPHLSYAFQWWFFSAGAVVVYALILRSVARSADD